MADQSLIEWTEATWNPLVGCSRVSEGCRHCYAERTAFRASAMGISRYDGTTKKVGDEIRWTGKVNLVESALELPLRWKKPRRIFVNSMSDLFHESVPDEWIQRIYDIMGISPQHTFQVLTKRPQRALNWFVEWYAQKFGPPPTRPFPNVWLGVSVEDQATADERIPLLLQTPAAVRWVSYEPALGPVDFSRWLPVETIGGVELERWLDWIVVGGESGPGARPFDLAWARQTIAQGRAAGVPVFVKQLGAKIIDPRLPAERPWFYTDKPVEWKEWPNPKGWWCRPGTGDRGPTLYDRKGGDMAEWPEDLRVREHPR